MDILANWSLFCSRILVNCSESGTGEAPFSSLPRCLTSWGARVPSRCRDSASAQRQWCSIDRSVRDPGHPQGGRRRLRVAGVGTGLMSMSRETVPRMHVTDKQRWRDAVQTTRPSSSKAANRLQGRRSELTGHSGAVAFSVFCDGTCLLLAVTGRCRDTRLASDSLDWRAKIGADVSRWQDPRDKPLSDSCPVFPGVEVLMSAFVLGVLWQRASQSGARETYL